MSQSVKFWIVGLAAVALGACGAAPESRAVFAVPNYKALQGDIAADLSTGEIADGESVSVEGDVDLVIAARYRDGTVVEQSVIEQIRECAETVCSVEMLLAPGSEVLFDAVATGSGAVVRRGMAVADMVEGEQTDVLLTMWPATHYDLADTIMGLDVVRGDTSLGLILTFDGDVDEPAFVANNANLGGHLALDFSSQGFAPITGPLSQDIDPASATHLILLNGTPAGSYFPMLPSDSGVVTVQGMPASLLSYQIYGKIVVLTLPYEAVANRDVVLAGSLAGSVSIGDSGPVRIPAQGTLALKP